MADNMSYNNRNHAFYIEFDQDGTVVAMYDRISNKNELCKPTNPMNTMVEVTDLEYRMVQACRGNIVLGANALERVKKRASDRALIEQL